MTEGSPVRTTLVPAPQVLGRILLVDDDFAIQEGVAEFLECEGFYVVSASNGLDALNQLRSGLRVDAIVLDVMMPMMDGWDFRAQQLADGTLCHIPVVIITATGVAGDAIREQFKVDDVFSKPLDLRHFVKAVREACKCSDPGQTSSASGA
jgi:CheY-like chemotaxis protein